MNWADRPIQNMKMTLGSVDDDMVMHASQILWTLEHKVATRNMVDTASSGAGFVTTLSSTSFDEELGDDPIQAFQDMRPKKSLRRRLLFLDAAAERHLPDNLWDLRETCRFAGVALATAEHLPSLPRFRGLGFQSIVVWLGCVVPVGEWEGASTPPI